MTLSEQDKKVFLGELFEFLRIPSVSTLPEHKPDIRRAVDWLSAYLHKLGFEKENVRELYGQGLSEQNAHPVIFAERRARTAGAPVILIYGHYDVQPAEPLAEWQSPPFEPEVRDGNIYARGATDDKGQIFSHLAALALAARQWSDDWPVSVKLLIEGEEEMGGKNIESLVKDPANRELFAADYCLVSDTGFVAEGVPTIEYGLRGIAYFQIDVALADHDLHSGMFGGGVLNPATALAEMLAKLHDPETGALAIPDIYDAVVPIREEERENLARIPFSMEQFLKEAGNAKAAKPEAGYSVVESSCARPSLDINGIWAGFTGEGAKTIIPAVAHAKVSIRTVANQEPAEVARLFEKYITDIAPKEVSVSVKTLHLGDGVLVDTNSPGVRLAAQALEETFGGKTVFSRSGGSIPVVALFKKHLALDPVLVGYGLPDDALHAPNEKYALGQFYGGIACNRRLYELIAEHAPTARA